MRLFEDIIDSVEAAQDVQSASSVVSAEDEQLYTVIQSPPDTELQKQMFSEYSHCIMIYSSSSAEERNNEELKRKISVLVNIMDSSPVIDDHSIVYSWLTLTGVTHLTVWFNFNGNPDYTSFLTFLMRLNNFFWNSKANSVFFKISDWHKDHQRVRLEVYMNNFKTSLWKHLKDIQTDIRNYLKTHNDFQGCDLFELTNNSGLLISIASTIYNKFTWKRDTELLYAILDFDVDEIYAPSNPDLKRKRY